MPKVKKVIVTVGGTVNLGNYQNAKREYTLEAELLKGETELDAAAALTATGTILFARELRSIAERDLADISGGWVSGVSADRVRMYVESANGFDYLKLLSPIEADNFLESMVDRYASPPVAENTPPDDEVHQSYAYGQRSYHDLPFGDEDDEWDEDYDEDGDEDDEDFDSDDEADYDTTPDEEEWDEDDDTTPEPDEERILAGLEAQADAAKAAENA